MRNNIRKQIRWFCILVIGLSIVACNGAGAGSSSGSKSGGSSKSGGKSKSGDGDSSSTGAMPLSNLYEVALCVEGYNIDGNVNVSQNELSIDGTPITSYNWEGWSNDKASGTITPSGSSAQTVNNNSQRGTSTAGSFSCNWTQASGANSGNFLARSGKKWEASNQTHTQIGNISVNYDASSYNPTGNGVSYLCVYGWMRNSTSNPSLLIEYYIVDNWGQYNQPVANWETTRQHKGTFTIDGGTYDIWTVQKTNAPSINGDRNFVQYWSVRQTRRSSGTISVSEHFKKWASIK